MRCAAATRTASPVSCPRLSLISLKKSRSMNSRPSVLRRAARLLDLLGQAVLEHVAVGQAGEDVEIGLLPEQVGRALAVRDVAGNAQHPAGVCRLVGQRRGVHLEPAQRAVDGAQLELEHAASAAADPRMQVQEGAAVFGKHERQHAGRLDLREAVAAEQPETGGVDLQHVAVAPDDGDAFGFVAQDGVDEGVLFLQRLGGAQALARVLDDQHDVVDGAVGRADHAPGDGRVHGVAVLVQVALFAFVLVQAAIANPRPVELAQGAIVRVRQRPATCAPAFPRGNSPASGTAPH